MKSFKFLLVTLNLAFLLNTSLLFASPICGELWHTNGPFDYTDPNVRHTLKMVEGHHFTKQVEQLIAGATGLIAADLNFVLRVFPNHHRALHALSRLSLRDKTPQPPGASFSTLCYFDRAVRFKPKDVTVRSLYSNHLVQINKIDLALEQLLFAADIEPDNPTTNYNLGLLYLKQKNYDKALYFAKKAYDQGFPLPGLKNRLVAAGKWK